MGDLEEAGRGGWGIGVAHPVTLLIMFIHSSIWIRA